MRQSLTYDICRYTFIGLVTFSGMFLIWGCDQKSHEFSTIQYTRDGFHYQMLPKDEVKLPSPRHITVDKKGRRIILDTVGRILIYSPDGKLIRQWRMPRTEDGRPEGVCVLKDGRIAVADTHYQRILFSMTRGSWFIVLVGDHR